MKKFLTFIIVALFGVITMASLPQPEQQGNGAFVLVQGEGGAFCGDWRGENFFFGPATILKTPNGNVQGGCHMQLVSGPGLDRVERSSGGFPFGDDIGFFSFICVFTPGGAGSCRFS